MNIVFVEHRPFSHFLKNGFRQRVGRILHHFIQEQRIERLIYLWWNQEPFSSGSDVKTLPEGFEKVALCESRRSRLPFARSLHIDTWNERHRLASTAAKLSRFDIGPSWVWATDPRICRSVRLLADRIGGKLAYDLIDNFAVYEGVDKKQRLQYLNGYKQAGVFADRILTNNPQNAKSLSLPANRTRVVSNGVDWDCFHKTIGGPEPADIAEIRRPRVGFVGNMSNVTDSNLINAVAAEIPECKVVCIGSIKGTNTPLHPRIHCLGIKPYNEIPAYMAALDIGISIYRVCEATTFINSQKIYEYLAAGRPVVTTNAQPHKLKSSYVMSAESVIQFVAFVRNFLLEADTEILREARSQSVKHEDWRNRIAEIIDFLETSSP